MVDFLKWLTLTVTYFILIIVVELNYGFFFFLANLDKTYICYGLWGVFFVGIFIALLNIIDKNNNFNKLTAVAELSTVLGLLGSVLGIGYTFYYIAQSQLDFTSKENVISMMKYIIEGMGYALSTTIMGIIVAVSLILYILILKKDYRSET